MYTYIIYIYIYDSQAAAFGEEQGHSPKKSSDKEVNNKKLTS